MIESKLRQALETSEKGITDKAIDSRINRARAAERILQRDLDYVVSTDEKMYSALVELRSDSSERKTGRLQNAVRWYYRAKNGKDFPKISDYELVRPYLLMKGARFL